MTTSEYTRDELKFREGLATSLASIDGRLKLLDLKVETVNDLARIRHRDVAELAAVVKAHEVKIQQATGAAKILAAIYAVVITAIGSILYGIAKKLGWH